MIAERADVASHAQAPFRPPKIDPARYPRVFARGHLHPRGVAWFGVRSFWGHLQHLLASAIASENIDSRDWMHADPPERLGEQVVRLIGGVDGDAETITEGLGRELWIDFIADTGDDAAVSEAVGRLLCAPYDVPDPEKPGEFLIAPRGDLLLFGGDTAYPVASAGEVHDRVIVPFNKALVERRDGKRRAILGIPGNHDWYDGLDGFARMFRKRIGDLNLETAPPSALDQTPSVIADRESRFEHVVDFVEQFVSGGVVTKRKALVLDGYVPLQHASYFVLPLAPGLDLFAVDRQLRNVDFRQRKYFAARRAERPDHTLCVLLPDPVYAYLEESPTGVSMVRSLKLDLDRKEHFVLSGDLHHYERRTVGKTLHVTAGGGGAFLHPPRIVRSGISPLTDAEWPDVATAKKLLSQVPFQVAAGRSGFIPHLLLLVFFAPALGIGSHYGELRWAMLVAGLVIAVACALIGGIRTRKNKLGIAAFSALTGGAIVFIPVALSRAIAITFARAGDRLPPMVLGVLLLLLAAFVGAFVFGAFLAALTRFGLEHAQAFTALGHPGFKHFVRLRVRADGSAIDAWCLGLASPLRAGEQPVLVDTFTFRSSPRKRSS